MAALGRRDECQMPSIGRSASCAAEATGDGLNVTPVGGSTSNRTACWRRAARRVTPAEQDAGGERDNRERRRRADIHPAPPAVARRGRTPSRRQRPTGGQSRGRRRSAIDRPRSSPGTSNDGLGERRRERLKGRHRRRLTLEDRRDQARWRLTFERFSRGEHFIEHAAERNMSVRVSASRPSTCSGAMYWSVPRIVPSLVTGFGAVAAIDKPLTAGQWPQLRETEIEQLDATLRHHDVSRFEIAMHDAGKVCLVECVGDLDCRLQRLLELERPASQAVRERLTLPRYSSTR